MKLTKKILAVVLSVLFVVGVFAGCSSKDANTKDTTTKASASSDIKVGFIFLHDENSTYDKNFITAADEACKTLGIADENKIYKTNVPEGQECAEAAEEGRGAEPFRKIRRGPRWLTRKSILTTR